MASLRLESPINDPDPGGRCGAHKLRKRPAQRRLRRPRHHNLKRQLRPRHPHEQPPARPFVQLLEIHLRQHDPHGALPFEPMHGLDQELAP